MDKKKALLIKMDAETHMQLKLAATRRNKNMTAIVLHLIKEFLKEKQSEKA